MPVAYGYPDRMITLHPSLCCTRILCAGLRTRTEHSGQPSTIVPTCGKNSKHNLIIFYHTLHFRHFYQFYFIFSSFRL